MGERTVLPAGLPPLVSGIDVSDFGESRLVSLLAEVRAIQRCLDGLVIRIAVRSDRLADTGHCAPSVETLRGDGAVGAAQARRDSARAEAAGSIEGLTEAASAGEISGEHVDSFARHSAKLSDDQRTVFDFQPLVAKAGQLPPETFDRLVKRSVEAVLADHGLADTKTKQAESSFRHWFDTTTGMGRFSGSLDPERYETLTTVIEQHTASLAAAADTSVTKSANLAAAALVDLVTGSGDGFDARNRLPAVTVIVDHDTLTAGPHAQSIRQTENGHDLAPESLARLCCDSVMRRVTVDDRGIPINVGRRYRTCTDAQWAALKTMYDSCGWDQCTAPLNWCQAHHILEWEHGGATDLDNLIPFCSQHHHRVHEGQWHIKLLPDRTLETHKPDGSHHKTTDPPQRC